MRTDADEEAASVEQCRERANRATASCPIVVEITNLHIEPNNGQRHSLGTYLGGLERGRETHRNTVKRPGPVAYHKGLGKGNSHKGVREG
jgi:hypothetical protein